MEEYLPVLLKMRLFEGIQEERIETVADLLGRCAAHIPEGRTYPACGTIPCAGAGILLEGRAQIYTEDVQGVRTIVAQVEQSELFAESFACANVSRMPVSVEALADCAVLFVDCKRHRVGVYVKLRVSYAVDPQHDVSARRKKTYCKAAKSGISLAAARGKSFCLYLNDQAAIHRSSQFIIPFTRQELADYLCVDRSAMSAELSRLQNEGVLSYHKSAFKLTPISNS